VFTIKKWSVVRRQPRAKRGRANVSKWISDSNHRNHSGFTLVEMLIASLVFSVAVVSLMSMVLFALTARFSARIESAALKLSQQKVEDLKSHRLDDPLLSISGNSLNGAGEINFEAGADPQATTTTELTLNKARDTKLFFETRWNVTAVGHKKVITVATRRTSGMPTSLKPVNLKIALAP
jgi:prepilin-type N-terminal cleavage/methylation domain-containing protein